MAGEWLKFEKATLDKPEVFAIADATGLDPDAVIGKLVRVWAWFDSHTIDGNAARVTPSLLDRVAGAQGFIQAMASEGWASVADGGVTLPRFDRHNGETSKQRALTAKRVAKTRSESNANSNGTSNAPPVTSALAREEKRRTKKQPLTPKGDEVEVVKRKRRTKDTILFTEFVANCRAAGEKAIPDDDPVFKFADKVFIPREFLRLAWMEFRNRYKDSGKGQKNWRGHFSNAVRLNWYKLWWFPKEGECELTTAGVQLKREHEANQQAQAQQQEAQA